MTIPWVPWFLSSFISYLIFVKCDVLFHKGVNIQLWTSALQLKNKLSYTMLSTLVHSWLNPGPPILVSSLYCHSSQVWVIPLVEESDPDHYSHHSQSQSHQCLLHSPCFVFPLSLSFHVICLPLSSLSAACLTLFLLGSSDHWKFSSIILSMNLFNALQVCQSTCSARNMNHECSFSSLGGIFSGVLQISQPYSFDQSLGSSRASMILFPGWCYCSIWSILVLWLPTSDVTHSRSAFAFLTSACRFFSSCWYSLCWCQNLVSSRLIHSVVFLVMVMMLSNQDCTSPIHFWWLPPRSLFDVGVPDIASNMMTAPISILHPNGLGEHVYLHITLFLTLPGTGISWAISGMILGEWLCIAPLLQWFMLLVNDHVLFTNFTTHPLYQFDLFGTLQISVSWQLEVW